MPENPLLPNAKLQQLYTLMLRARESAVGLEAILAAVSLMLEPTDAAVSSNHINAFAQLLTPARRTQSAARSLTAAATPLAFAAGAAAGAQVAGNSGLIAVLLDGRQTEADWAAVLGQAQSDRLPLIVICLDTPAKASSAKSSKPAANGPLTWAMLNPIARKLHFPILTVDGADAVAVYRAMQESVLRARHGDGPALLWCLMPPTRTRAKHPSNRSNFAPVERLERYLAARKIPLPRLAPPASRK